MERHGRDGGSPTSRARNEPVADRVEKFGAYPPPGSLLCYPKTLVSIICVVNINYF
jgi:hypothetical protein